MAAGPNRRERPAGPCARSCEDGCLGGCAKAPARRSLLMNPRRVPAALGRAIARRSGVGASPRPLLGRPLACPDRGGRTASSPAGLWLGSRTCSLGSAPAAWIPAPTLRGSEAAPPKSPSRSGDAWGVAFAYFLSCPSSVIIGPMKNRRDRTQRSSDVLLPSLLSLSPAQNIEFARAFADALRDILRDERVRAHG